MEVKSVSPIHVAGSNSMTDSIVNCDSAKQVKDAESIIINDDDVKSSERLATERPSNLLPTISEHDEQFESDLLGPSEGIDINIDAIDEELLCTPSRGGSIGSYI